MGKCTLTIDQTRILNGKTNTGYADNDFGSLTVTVNDVVAFNNTFPLVNPKFTGSGQQNIFGGGDAAMPWGASVDCQDGDIVMAYFSIINLSSYSWDDQVAAAAQFTQNVVDVVAQVYIQAAEIVLGAASAIAAPAAAAAFAGATDEVLQAFSSAVEKVFDNVFTNEVIPLLSGLADVLQRLITGRADCNGLVLHDYVIFLPRAPKTPLHISKTYEGPQTNRACGEAPHTALEITMQRLFDDIHAGPLRPGELRKDAVR